jgi:CubicO group peptidase (beta-lactamase class C family)
MSMVAGIAAPVGRARMKPSLRLAVSICASLCAAAASMAAAPPEARALPAEVDAELTALERNGFSGVVLWTSKGTVLLEKGYGFADREAKRRTTPRTVFDIGSIVKPITASAIWKLEAEGRLTTSDRISKFFEKVPADKAEITVQHLVSHTSGLENIFGDDYEVVTRDWVLDKALSSTLRGKPGDKARYSNAGYSLLAMIVEKVSGQPYERYVHDHILAPAGTPRIGYRIPRWAPEEVAVGYRQSRRWGSPFDHPWADDGPSWNLRGNGGMLSTAADLYRLMEALQNGPVLPEAARARFKERYVRTAPDGSRRIRTIGGNGIFNADYIKSPDEDVTLMMMTNVDKFQAEEITPRLMNRVFRATPAR